MYLIEFINLSKYLNYKKIKKELEPLFHKNEYNEKNGRLYFLLEDKNLYFLERIEIKLGGSAEIKKTKYT